MVPESVNGKTVCVIGLGYVGLPLAEAFTVHLRTIGYRRNQQKADELNRTPGNRIEATTDPKKIKEADFVIIAVPTPVTKAKDPDLKPVESASKIVGQNLKKGAIVVLESTVYPGVCEGIMGPILERESGLKCGKDFFIGYSPERTNPGDEVYHLGAQSHVRVSFDTPEYTGNVTALGTTRLLETVRRSHQSIKFYQASSSEMFGATSPPQDEDTAFHPRSP